MIDLPNDIEDRAAYPLVDQQDRWIFNKLTLAERLGYSCGPSGTEAPAGDYCIRPTMNCAGNGIGGVLMYTHDGTPEAMPFIPGYFWCERFRGRHGWTDFTDDLPVDETIGLPAGRRFDYTNHNPGDPFEFPTLPPRLRGLSKHLLVEHIGGNIIEVSPRHQVFTLGRGQSYMQKIQPKLAWGFDDDAGRAFYWRTLQK